MTYPEGATPGTFVRDVLLLVLGGLITIAVAMVIEYLRRPKLTISIAQPDELSIGPAGARSLQADHKKRTFYRGCYEVLHFKLVVQ
jgi:hypothetical protein